MRFDDNSEVAYFWATRYIGERVFSYEFCSAQVLPTKEDGRDVRISYLEFHCCYILHQNKFVLLCALTLNRELADLVCRA